MSDEAIHKAVDAARTFLQNDAERLAYINRELAILDYNSDWSYVKFEYKLN